MVSISCVVLLIANKGAEFLFHAMSKYGVSLGGGKNNQTLLSLKLSAFGNPTWPFNCLCL